MNIKVKIGQRIREQREAKGLTRKALAELITNLKPPTLNNWERGDRTPGPEEITLLAKALDASPAFLMCLTDENKAYKPVIHPQTQLPLLSHKQASDYKAYVGRIRDKSLLVAVSYDLAAQLGEDAFALKMIDDSMTPEMRVNDIQIIDPGVSPSPGDYVVVKINGKNDVFICQYKQLSYTSDEFELLTLNDKWPNITANDKVDVEIIGKVVQSVRSYL